MKSRLIAGAALLWLSASSAWAATPIWVTLTGLPAQNASNIVSTDSYYTGPIAFTTTSSEKFTVFCTDLEHNVGLGGQYEYVFGALTENGLGAPISEKTSNEIGQIAALYKNGTGDWSIAAQAAIWSLAYPGLSQTISDPTVLADYNAILGKTYVNTGRDALALIPYGSWPSGGQQEMVYGVPEPSTWAMMMLGFVCLGFARYRRGQAARVAA
jgi:hypothetical protein